MARRLPSRAAAGTGRQSRTRELRTRGLYMQRIFNGGCRHFARTVDHQGDYDAYCVDPSRPCNLSDECLCLYAGRTLAPQSSQICTRWPWHRRPFVTSPSLTAVITAMIAIESEIADLGGFSFSPSDPKIPAMETRQLYRVRRSRRDLASGNHTLE